MRQMTGKEFSARIRRDPSWAKNLTEPIEITTFCNLDGSLITHLSPFLTFRGRNKTGNVASFRNCPNLEVAEGNFDGFVDFGRAWIEKGRSLKEVPTGVKKIGKLRIIRPNDYGDAVNFEGCEGVQHYRGTYPGAVTIGHSENIELINLIVTKANNRGFALCISEAEVGKVEGRYKGTFLMHFSRVRTLGAIQTEPGYEDKNLFMSVGSTIVDLGSPEEFPFSEDQVGWEQASDEEEVDENLKELLKIKSAISDFTARQEAKRSLEPWGKKWKREAFKSLAETLEVDDMLKNEGFQIQSKGRFGLLKKSSTIICTLLVAFGISVAADVGKVFREKYISGPVAEQIADVAHKVVPPLENPSTIQRYAENPKDPEAKRRLEAEATITRAVEAASSEASNSEKEDSYKGREIDPNPTPKTVEAAPKEANSPNPQILRTEQLSIIINGLEHQTTPWVDSHKVEVDAAVREWKKTSAPKKEDGRAEVALAL